MKPGAAITGGALMLAAAVAAGAFGAHALADRLALTWAGRRRSP
jgi:uncharacterized membrane protein YgdD (TMEM256/DUF423 family)